MTKLYNKLKELGFKFTMNPPTGSVYLMPTGEFLDIDAHKDILGLPEYARAVHGSLDQYLLDLGLIENSETLSRALCETDNAVRLNDGTLFKVEVLVGLPPKQLTPAQYTSLENWLYSIMYKSDGVFIGDEINSNGVYYKFASIKNLDGYTPEDIIKKIKNFYNSKTGILKEKYLLNKYKNMKG